MSTDTLRSTTVGPVRGLTVGIGAGVIASIAMGLYAMVASLAKDTGFFTPLHHIATLFTGPTDMMASMMASGSFEIAAGTAIVGLMIHMVTGAVYGGIFGMVVTQVKLTGAGLLAVVGVVYGALVFVMSAYVGVPLAAAVLGVDDLAQGPMAGKNSIADMAEMAGWGTFVAEHLVFGLVLGLLVVAGTRRRA